MGREYLKFNRKNIIFFLMFLLLSVILFNVFNDSGKNAKDYHKSNNIKIDYPDISMSLGDGFLNSEQFSGLKTYGKVPVEIGALGKVDPFGLK